jgi:hypothetical protein
MSNQEIHIGNEIYVHYEEEKVILQQKIDDVVLDEIALTHDNLRELGKYVLSLQHNLHQERMREEALADPSGGELEEVSLEDELLRVQDILRNAGVFERDKEPEQIALMRVDCEFAEKALQSDEPTDKIKAMGLLARWS